MKGFKGFNNHHPDISKNLLLISSGKITHEPWKYCLWSHGLGGLFSWYKDRGSVNKLMCNQISNSAQCRDWWLAVQPWELQMSTSLAVEEVAVVKRMCLKETVLISIYFYIKTSPVFVTLKHFPHHQVCLLSIYQTPNRMGRNWVRNWCQKWHTILFTVTNQENKQWDGFGPIFLYDGSLFFLSSSEKKFWPTFWKNSIGWRVHYLARTQNTKRQNVWNLSTYDEPKWLLLGSWFGWTGSGV